MTEAVQTSRPSPQYIVQVQPRFNGMAIAAFVVVFFASVVGLVLGYVAIGQITKTGDRGHGFALAAVVLGWIGTVGALLLAAVLLVGAIVLKAY